MNIVENCHPGVEPYVTLPNDKKYDLLICKDVLEHIEVEDILGVLDTFREKLTSSSLPFL